MSKRPLFLAVILFVLSMSAFAQQNMCKVTGKVIVEENSQMPYVSVYASLQDSVVAGTLTDQNGQFTLKVPQSLKTYTLTVVWMGYKTKHIDFTADKTELALGTVQLEAMSQVLDEVSISAQGERDNIITASCMTISNFGATDEMGGTIADLLRQESSVTVDPDGNVSIRGNGNVLLLLDGVPTNLGSINAIPSSNVASIEIITNPNASYDAEGTGGIINIVTKKDGKKGLSGMAAVNYGFNHFTNGSLALNYTRKKFVLRFNYQVKYEDDINDGYLYRFYRTTGDSLSQQIHALRTVFNNNIALGVTIKPNMRNKIDADFRLILPRLNTVQDLSNDWYHNGILSHENRRSDVTWNRENLDGTLAYWHAIRPGKLTFSVKANVSKIWGHRPSYYFLEGDSVSKSVSGGSPLLTSAQTDWRIIKKYGFWDAGVKFSYRQNNIYHNFYTCDSLGWDYSHQFSNDLLHREYVPAAYVQFTSTKWRDRFTWSAGLRAEYSRTHLHSEKEMLDEWSQHFFLGPSLSFKYKISKKHSLSFAYSRRITRPTYPQLNPYMSMIDPHNFEQGNMHLQPETADNAELLYQFKVPKWAVNVGIYGNYIHNYITQVARFEGDILLMTYINATSQTKAGLDLSVKADPWKWMTATLGTNTYYLRSVGNIGEWDISNSGWVNNSNLRLDFRPIKGMNINLQYFFNTPQYYPQFTTRLSHYLNIGISQKFLKGALTVSAQLTDVFNTRKWEIFSDNQYYRLDNMLHGKSRMFWLGVSYNFNAYKKAGAGKTEGEDRSKIRTGV
ncbi:MAG: TonB-dependent receptor family protein [Bacteroidales bacterium]|nr:TonB-dependent receptor family protein [Bacteroidales bacterium]